MSAAVASHLGPRLRGTPPAAAGDRLAPRLFELAFVALVLSTTVLERFGLNFGSYSCNAALFAMYAFLGVAGVRGALTVSPARLTLYGACMTVALASAMLNERASSLSSVALLAVMYLPFVFVLAPGSDLGPERARRVFLDVAFACAIAGILQFYAQRFVHADWLFDFTPRIPTFLRGPSGYNTVIPVAGSFKSNGFFFREPSGASFVLALALMMEVLGPRRLARVAALGLALLLTYSGTGLLALAIGLAVPMTGRNLVRVALVLGVGACLFLLLEEPLNLSFTLARLDEFGSERSSAYIRYVAPARLLTETAANAPWLLWFGHGPGTIFQQTIGYEFHDPTWAKLIFEYGIVGFVAFVSLFLVALAVPAAPLRVRAMLFAGWLIMGGHLLSPEQNFMTLALVGLLPAAEEPSAAPGARRRVGLAVPRFAAEEASS
jgi:hypothetical protein